MEIEERFAVERGLQIWDSPSWRQRGKCAGACGIFSKPPGSVPLSCSRCNRVLLMRCRSWYCWVARRLAR